MDDRELDCPDETTMPQQVHVETHSTLKDFVRDSVIGLSDGLTVPFALAAGLAGAVGSVSVIVTAGLAEIAAGSIAMGLGGFLAARGDEEHYEAERKREEEEIAEAPGEEEWEVVEILRRYGLDAEEARPVVAALRRDPRVWTDFMMRFELGLEPPELGRPFLSAMTIALAYIVGGIVPLVPYMLLRTVSTALPISTIVTMTALLAFGAAKSRFSGAPLFRSALKTLLIGVVAAAAAYIIARLIS